MNHPARKVLLFFFISAHFLQGIYSIEEQREEIFKERVDWRDSNKTGLVRDQGDCDSCWAFVTADLMASHLSIKNKRPFEELSSQQLIDCSRFNFTKEEKCGKNSIVEALIYVDNSGGLTTSKEYPDSKNSDRKCLKYSKEKLVKNTRVGFIRNEIGILETLKNRGPVAVKIPAFRDLFDYKKGIYYKKNCSKFKPNHLMIIVGYGYDSKTKTPYWILKNSWGESWGEKGYMRLSANETNMCGIVKGSIFVSF